MDNTYLEIMDARTGDAHHTGIAAVFESLQETRLNFENARHLECLKGGFLLDIYIEGNLEDTIELDETGVELVTGISPLSIEEYTEIDRQYWERAKANEK